MILGLSQVTKNHCVTAFFHVFWPRTACRSTDFGGKATSLGNMGYYITWYYLIMLLAITLHCFSLVWYTRVSQHHPLLNILHHAALLQHFVQTIAPIPWRRQSPWALPSGRKARPIPTCMYWWKYCNIFSNIYKQSTYTPQHTHWYTQHPPARKRVNRESIERERERRD